MLLIFVAFAEEAEIIIYSDAKISHLPIIPVRDTWYKEKLFNDKGEHRKSLLREIVRTPYLKVFKSRLV